MNLALSDLDILAHKIADIIGARMTISSKWLTQKEAEKYAKASRDTLKKWESEGFIYAKKTTGGWRYDRESIDNYFNSDRLTRS